MTEIDMLARPQRGGGQSADAMFEFVRSRESHARTYADSVSRVITRGRSTVLEDTHGRTYLDFLSAAGTLALGHNHPQVLESVRRHLESGQIQQGLDITTPEKYEFMKALLSLLPVDVATTAKIQFCGPTGADAAEAAIKLFKTATGRRTILSFHGAYHGMTAGALSLTGNLTAKQRVASLMPDVHFLPFPYPYRCPFGVGGEEGAAISLRYIERVLTDPASGITTPAAVFVEAIQGEGGVIPAPAEWLHGLRKVTADLGIPLVVDEVQSGFGRTGTMFAFEVAGIKPDAVLLSKAVGGGFPMSLLVYDEKYDQWEPGAHAGTFRGNQIAMVAGTAMMGVIESERLVEQAAAKGLEIGAALHAIAASHPEIGDIRGRGLMWGLEIVDPASRPDQLGARPGDGMRANAVKRRCLEHGLVVETGGRHGAVIRLLPPLTVTSAEIAQMATALEMALVDCS